MIHPFYTVYVTPRVHTFQFTPTTFSVFISIRTLVSFPLLMDHPSNTSVEFIECTMLGSICFNSPAGQERGLVVLDGRMLRLEPTAGFIKVHLLFIWMT